MSSPARLLCNCTVAVAIGLAMAGCGDGEGADGAAKVDSTLVDVLVDLHLADARGEIEGSPDSLRQLVYAVHATDSTRLQERIDALASEPGAALDLTEAVEQRLSDDLNGMPSPAP